MKKSIAVLLLILMLLLGVQRTPEAQVGEALIFVGSAVVTGIVVGGCVHAVASAKPDADPAVVLPSTEPPATLQ